MKLLAYLKITLRQIIMEFPSFILSYAIYPIVVALLMGFIQKDMFTPKINEPIISVSIRDEDNTKESLSLTSYLSSEEISKIININTDGNSDYELIIPIGYSKSLIEKRDAQIEVIVNENSSTTLGNLLVSIVDRYNQDESQRLLLNKKLDEKNLTLVEKENLMNEINTSLDKVYKTELFNSNIYQVRRALNSYEYFSVSFLSFAFIIFILGVIGGEAVEKETGLYSRIMSTSISRIEYFNLGFMSNFTTMIVANSLYILVFRLSGLSFRGSVPILIILILTQSLMITAIGTLISSLFKKNTAMAIVQIFLIFQVVLGGMVGPLDKLNDNQIFKLFAKYKPDILIANSYKNYLLYNNLSSVYIYLLIMIGISIIIYLINILTVSMKWGVSK